MAKNKKNCWQRNVSPLEASDIVQQGGWSWRNQGVVALRMEGRRVVYSTDSGDVKPDARIDDVVMTRDDDGRPYRLEFYGNRTVSERAPMAEGGEFRDVERYAILYTFTHSEVNRKVREAAEQRQAAKEAARRAEMEVARRAREEEAVADRAAVDAERAKVLRGSLAGRTIVDVKVTGHTVEFVLDRGGSLEVKIEGQEYDVVIAAPDGVAMEFDEVND